jgi:hypothetical protein
MAQRASVQCYFDAYMLGDRRPPALLIILKNVEILFLRITPRRVEGIFSRSREQGHPGTPAAGKTTWLLTRAQDLLVRAVRQLRKENADGFRDVRDAERRQGRAHGDSQLR